MIHDASSPTSFWAPWSDEQLKPSLLRHFTMPKVQGYCLLWMWPMLGLTAPVLFKLASKQPNKEKAAFRHNIIHTSNRTKCV